MRTFEIIGAGVLQAGCLAVPSQPSLQCQSTESTNFTTRRRVLL